MYKAASEQAITDPCARTHSREMILNYLGQRVLGLPKSY